MTSRAYSRRPDRAGVAVALLILLLLSAGVGTASVVSAGLAPGGPVAPHPGPETRALGPIVRGRALNATYPIAFAESNLTSGTDWSVSIPSTAQRLGSVPVGPSPIAEVFDPAQGTVYTANYWGANVTIFDGASGALVATVAVGNNPYSLAYDPVNGFVYVANFGGHNVTVINGSSDALANRSSIAVGSAPIGVAYDSGTNQIFVTNYGSDNLTVINATSDTVAVPSIAVGVNPAAPAYDPQNGLVYYVHGNWNNISAVNGSTDNVSLTSLVVGQSPWAIAYSSASGDLYVADESSNEVAVVDGLTNSVIANISVATYPDAVAYDPANDMVYVAIVPISAGQDGNITVINDATRKVVSTGEVVGNLPDAIAIDSRTGSVLVANINNDNVSVIGGQATDVASAVAPNSVLFHLINGTYSFTVASPGGWVPCPASGSIHIDGSGENVSVDFAKGGGCVTFTETGLPGGHEWWVNVTGRAALSSSDSAITSLLPNGTYSYSASSNDTAYRAAGANITVHGHALSVSVTFSPVSYPVDFHESGLVGGTKWEVWLNSTAGGSDYHDSSTGTNLSLASVNGTYDYAIGRVAGFYLSSGNYSGSLSVNGTPDWVNVSFVQVVYPVTFAETGLPNGTEWWINLTDGQSIAATSNRSTVPEPNGTYAYGLASADPTFAAPGGAVIVKGSPVNATIAEFSRVTYPVDLSEVGLPVGADWYVNVTSGPANFTLPDGSAAAGGAITLHLMNGSFSYTVASNDPDYHTTPTGNLSEEGGVPASVQVSFVETTYALTFAESGLPSGPVWWVNVTAQPSESSTGSTILLDVANGTYDYTVATSDKSYEAFGGSVSVDGGPAVQSVTFVELTFSITFETFSLPVGSAWWVNLTDGQSFGTTSSGVAFSEPNGTYHYAIGTSDKTYEAPAGAFTVSGAPGSPVTIDFSQFLSAVSVTEDGLPAGTEWYLNLTGATPLASTLSSTTLTLVNGSYPYTVATIDKTYSAPGGTLVVRGESVALTLTFVPVTYLLTFTETNLPSGVPWWVNLTNGQSFGSTGSTVTFSEPNATYSFWIGTADAEYRASGGAVAVLGGPQARSIEFRLVAFSLTFAETGLPAGTNWSITLSGVSHWSTSSQIVVSDPNGSYSFEVGAEVGYVPSPGSGSFSIDGSNRTTDVAFSPSTVPPQGSGGTGGASMSGAPIWVWAVVGLVVVAAIAGGVLVMRRRRGRSEDQPPPETPLEGPSNEGSGAAPESVETEGPPSDSA